MQKISDALLGCVEIPIFLKAGTGRFENSKKAALQSFLVAVLLLPVAAWTVPPSAEFQALPYGALLARFVIEFIFFSALYLGAVYLAVKQIKRTEWFYQFVNAQNWLNLSQLVLMVPVCIGVKAGHWTWQEGYAVLICILLYGYAYTAFAITYIFRINWMLAAGLSILGMAIAQCVHSVLYAI